VAGASLNETLWLNIGYTSPHRHLPAARTLPGPGRQPTTGQTKQLLGLPWRAAIALQDCGWFLRNAVRLYQVSCCCDWSVQRFRVCAMQLSWAVASCLGTTWSAVVWTAG
jgi:hypothetical protein